MKTPYKALLGCGCLLPLLLTGCISGVWLAPFPAATKVEWDHGVSLPRSAVVLFRKNTGVPWMDSHARAVVVIPRKDLPKFVAQLKPPRANYQSYQPWREHTGNGVMYYRCYSSSSDGLMIVTTTPTKNGRVKVVLDTYTD